jgi:glutathione S-transferase
LGWQFWRQARVLPTGLLRGRTQQKIKRLSDLNQHNLPVLYSFRRCPYAIRARMVLLQCGLQAEVREILLSAKPAAMIEASAKATVPVLCMTDGTVLDQSLDIIQWALYKSDDPAGLFTTERERQLGLVERNDNEFKYWLDRYKYHVRFPEEAPEHYRQQGMNFIAAVDARLTESSYLFGECPQIADIAVMPFVRQFRGVDQPWFDDNAGDAIRRWLCHWLESDSFAAAMTKYPVWQDGQSPVMLQPL